MYTYTTEIKSMLYSFGESKPQLTTTANYIEEIIASQIRQFLSKANDVRISRRGKVINMEDIGFVVRKDGFKLERLLNFGLER